MKNSSHQTSLVINAKPQATKEQRTAHPLSPAALRTILTESQKNVTKKIEKQYRRALKKNQKEELQPQL